MNTLEHAIVVPFILVFLISVCSMGLFLHDSICIEGMRGIWIQEEVLDEAEMEHQLQQQLLMESDVSVQLEGDEEVELVIRLDEKKKSMKIKSPVPIQKIQYYKVLLDGVEAMLQKGI